MTILEAIQANPVFSDVSENQINMIIGGRDIDGSTTYDSSSLKNLELVSADLYVHLATMPKLKEGDYVLEYNPKELLSRAKTIYRKHEDARLAEFAPTVIDLGVNVVE